MRRAIVDELPQKVGQKILLPDSESKHLTQVLRLRNGETIELLDGRGSRVSARLGFQDRGATAEALEAPSTQANLISLPLALVQAIIKGDAMEWVIEKAVELGVRKLIPIETEYSVVNIGKKGAQAFQERWQKIADQALKQCGRLDRMEVVLPSDLESGLQSAASMQLYWADEASDAQTPHLSQALILPKTNPAPSLEGLLIGPEGGFSPSERQRLLQLTTGTGRVIKRVHLGAPILRAETAALFGVSLMVGSEIGHGKRTNPI